MFEAFMVFYLLEVLVLTSVAVWYYKDPKKEFINKMPPSAKRPLAADLIKMRRFQEHMRRIRGDV